ncbi:MAG: phage tail protein [Chloroflexi bacterium]|nr:phage tail protein [Chloroflexota bacterium]MCI0574687.1 phage tail protein [Chloroflexota bacterium]MCI0647420.1 phage tail protein [Chloroflexota bacterium]MCI0726872.1 phage tail protein [Chloroflexota bacterium]
MAYERQDLPEVHSAFRFVVKIDGVSQAVFTECTLPNVEWEVEEVKEGGLNSFTHQLPGRRKAAKVTLKNGIGTGDLLEWYKKVMNQEYERRPVTITLLDVAHERVMDWNIQDAYPVKWTGPQLKTDTSAVAVETLELACGEVTVS